MKRRQWLGLALGAAVAPTADASGLVWRERALPGLGTTLWLRAAHHEAARAEQALDAAVAALREVERLMSLFDPASALAELNARGHLHDPHPLLVDLLRRAQEVSRRSGGAFDVTVQPLWALWDRARREARLPQERELAAARALVDWRALQIDERLLRFTRPGMAVTLNGIAQGLAADRARAALRAHGVAHALLDTGEWSPLGRSSDGTPWRLGLADPRDTQRVLATLLTDGRAVACSSDAEYRFGADHRHHHILDPRSGLSPPHLAAVVVAAPSATLADALTKVMFMGSAAQALHQARRWGVDVMTVDKSGRVRVSAGLKLA